MPKIVLVAGLAGALAGYGLEYWTQVIAWPMNIGGRPFHSWPHYIPVTFECTVLGASLTAFVGMLALNGLPKPYHPVFNVPEFDRASRDRTARYVDRAWQGAHPRFCVADAPRMLWSFERPARCRRP